MPVNPEILKGIIQKYGIDKVRSVKASLSARRDERLLDKVTERISNQKLPGEITDKPLVPMEQEMLSYTEAGDPMMLYEAGKMISNGDVLPGVAMAALTLAPQVVSRPLGKAIEGGIKEASSLGELRFIRNIGGLPEVGKSGGLTLAPQDKIFGNFSTDVPFRLHSMYPTMPGGEVMLVEPAALRGKTPWNIDPMDTFFRANELTDIDPKYVTLISGNENLLRAADGLGMDTKTSQGLIDAYKEVQQKIGTDSPMWYKDKPRGSIAPPSIFRDYRDEMDNLISNIGRPSKENYSILERMTGLRSGTSPDVGYGINDISDAISSLKPGVSPKVLRTADNWITFPDGRSFGFSDFRRLSNYLDNPPAFYKNVYYNPFPTAEDDLLRKIGGHGAQEYSPVYEPYLQELFEDYVNSSPLKKSGGPIHIKPSHRGKLTELKARTGKTEAELYNDGNPAHKKMVVFARNARKWSHADGGFLHEYPDGGRIRGKQNGKFFVTELSPRREKKFQDWYAGIAPVLGIDPNPDAYEHAYDYRGYWLNNRDADISSPDFHFPDTWKQPHHPTFSDESIYAKGREGVGHWEGDTFVPGPFNNLMQATEPSVQTAAPVVSSNYSPSEGILNYIKDIEQYRGDWYQDGNGVWTVGYGFTGDDVRKRFPNGMTRDEADRYFADTVSRRIPMFISATPNFDKLNQNQRDALFSYYYNIGHGGYTRKSPAMQKALEAMDLDTVVKNIDFGYNDTKNRGLRKRRDYERNLFGTPMDYGGYMDRLRRVYGDNESIKAAILRAKNVKK